MDKIHESQVATDMKLRMLQTGFDDLVRTNAGGGTNSAPTQAHLTMLAQNAAESYFRSLDLSGRIDTATEGATKASLGSVSNSIAKMESNLLFRVSAILSTNTARLAGSTYRTNVADKNDAQILGGLQVISKQIQSLQGQVNTLQARSDRARRQSIYAMVAGGVVLLGAGFTAIYVMGARTANLAETLKANLERDVQWFASNVQCVANAVSESLTAQRSSMAEHVQRLGSKCEAALSQHDQTLRQLHEREMTQIGELNRKLSSAGDEISTALKACAGELSSNRLEAELNAATMQWKKNFAQTLVAEQTRGETCVRQLLDSTDSATRECIEHVQRQFRETLEGEIGSARQSWARHLEQERQIFTSEFDGFVQRQTDVLKLGVQTTTQATQQMLHTELLRFNGHADQTLQNIRRELATTRDQMKAMQQSIGAEFDRLKERDEAFSNLLWPPCFHNGSLNVWRERITAGAIGRDSIAIELMLALGRYNNAGRNGGDLRKLAEALHAVSIGAYQFWKHSAAKVLDSSQEWKAAFQGALDASHTPLDIMMVLEGERFDMNTMLAADSGAGSRIVVRDVLSWIVRDKSGQAPKVLCHGRVTTG